MVRLAAQLERSHYHPMTDRGSVYHEHFEAAIKDLSRGHREAAHFVRDSLTAGGDELYFEATAKKKCNFRSAEGTCWIVIQGTKGRLSIYVRDSNRIVRDCEWFEVEESGNQFAKGGWRRIWLTVDDPSPARLEELRRLLSRLRPASR